MPSEQPPGANPTSASASLSASASASSHHRRYSAQIINQVPSQIPAPLNLIGANLLPDHHLLSKNTLHSHIQPGSTLTLNSQALPAQYATYHSPSLKPEPNPILPSPSDHEEADEFLPLQAHSDFVFPLPSSASSIASSAPSSASHNRRHSRVHSRNLSVFFPRPGQQPGSLPSTPHSAQTVDIPAAKLTAWAPDPGLSLSPPPSSDLRSPSSTHNGSAKGRRGHHHRHSLSHNFFPFLPEPPSSATAPAFRHASLSHPHPSATPGPVPLTPTTPLSAVPRPVPQTHPTLRESLPRAPLGSRLTHLPLPLRVVGAVIGHCPLATQAAMLAGVLTGGCGALVWLSGQAADCLCLTGLGYLVVFDALGALCRVWVEGEVRGMERLWEVLGRKPDAAALRLPFGRARSRTLAQFSQMVYLMFSAVYVSKEAVEHLLIDHQHAHAAVGHVGHPDHHQSRSEIPLPLLLTTTLLVLFSGFVTRNHLGLAQVLARIEQRPPLSKGAALNRFVWLTVGFAGLIGACGVLLSTEQMGRIDRLIAVLEVIVIWKLAWPVLRVTGKVLLQTAPERHASSGGGGAKSPDELRWRLSRFQKEQAGKVLKIDPPKIWSLTALGTDLVGSVVVHVPEGTSGKGIVAVGERVREAIEGVGKEISVEVICGLEDKKRRGGKKGGGGCGGHGHGHTHGHSHHHDHGHHDHGHHDHAHHDHAHHDHAHHDHSHHDHTDHDHTEQAHAHHDHSHHRQHSHHSDHTHHDHSHHTHQSHKHIDHHVDHPTDSIQVDHPTCPAPIVNDDHHHHGTCETSSDHHHDHHHHFH